MSAHPPSDQHAIVEALLRHLKRHPFTRDVKTWVSWESGDIGMMAPTAGQCPWVRLSPHPDSWSRFTGQPDYTAPILVKIEAAVSPVSLKASMRLWEALFGALKSFKDTNVSRLDIVRPAYGVSNPGDPALDNRILWARDGLIRLVAYERG